MKYIEALNKQQELAATTHDGPMRIIAGPGSGKTRTIIAKIIDILDSKKAFPSEIIVFTFTNKAANEIRERIKKELGTSFKNVFTFHSYAARKLREKAKEFSLDPNFRILDQKDQYKIIRDIIKADGLRLVDARDAIEYVSQSTRKSANANKDDRYKEQITQIYKKYFATKKEINAYDFDDLLVEFEKLLSQNKILRDQFISQYKYMMIDEFQDINEIQYNMIKHITTKDSNITVVGDTDQNIYSWRGARIDFLLNFDKSFSEVKTIILTKNYRSTPEIIEGANFLISNNEKRIKFDVEAVVPISENPIRQMLSTSSSDEAAKVVKLIKKLYVEEKIPLENIAVIYRANFISRFFEFELIKNGISYQLIGGFRFFDRKEVKDVLSFFYFLFKKDDFTLKIILEIIVGGVGPKKISMIQDIAKSENVSMWDLLSSRSVIKSENLDIFVEETKKVLEKINLLNTKEMLKKYLEKIGYFDIYREDENRIKNISGILQEIPKMIKDEIKEENNIDVLFHRITLNSSMDKGSIDGHVNLITAHASKGLEFDVVFIVHMNEGIFPTHQSIKNNSIEEERRLAYVAMTRAKKLLILSTLYGYDYIHQGSYISSRFLNEIKFNSSNETFYNSDPIKKNTHNKSKEELSSGDIIVHSHFGEGVVTIVGDSTFEAAFDRMHGIKKITKNHPSYVVKKKKNLL